MGETGFKLVSNILLHCFSNQNLLEQKMSGIVRMVCFVIMTVQYVYKYVYHLNRNLTKRRLTETTTVIQIIFKVKKFRGCF